MDRGNVIDLCKYATKGTDETTPHSEPAFEAVSFSHRWGERGHGGRDRHRGSWIVGPRPFRAGRGLQTHQLPAKMVTSSMSSLGRYISLVSKV